MAIFVYMTCDLAAKIYIYSFSVAADLFHFWSMKSNPYGGEDEETLEDFKTVIDVDVICCGHKTADKLPHNFQQCEHLCNYLLCPSQNFVSFRVRLLCMAFQIAV